MRTCRVTAMFAYMFTGHLQKSDSWYRSGNNKTQDLRLLCLPAIMIVTIVR